MARYFYGCIGLRQGLSTEALRFAATLAKKTMPNRPCAEDDAVNELRAQADSAASILRVASWLLNVTQACDMVIANPRLHAVTRIAQARLLAVAIHLRRDLDEATRRSLLGRWERVSFRIFGLLAHDARTQVGNYVRLAWRIVNEGISAEKIDAEIVQLGSKYSIEDATRALADANCYEGWESELRYFFFRYEEHLARLSGQKFSNEQWEKIWMVSPSESIEHIWPQSRAPESQKHRLGNLVLLPPKLNSALQAKPFPQKVEAYIQTGLLVAGKVAKDFGDTKWDEASISERERQLIAWAAQEWKD